MKLKGTLFRIQKGLSMLEYAILCALIALLLITGVASVGKKITCSFKNTGHQVATAGSYAPNQGVLVDECGLPIVVEDNQGNGEDGGEF